VLAHNSASFNRSSPNASQFGPDANSAGLGLKGETLIKFETVPVGGDLTLAEDEAKAKSADSLQRLHLCPLLTPRDSLGGASRRPKLRLDRKSPHEAQTGAFDPMQSLPGALHNAPPPKVVVNEMTTVASVWTHAQFLNGAGIKGHTLGLKIAAGNVPNFVDLQTAG
jgi:hypothetical protein